MKLHLALALSLLVACKKSDPEKPADPPPSPTERAGSAGPAPALGSGTTERGKHMMKDLDTNGDGVVSEEERAAGRKKRMENMRAKLDTNGDGKLTPDELKASTGRMKFDHPEELDTNHDGDISVDELEAGLKARRDARRAAAGSGSDSAGSAAAKVEETE